MASTKRTVALVTGAAGRLGCAIASRLAKDGHRIILVDIAESVHAEAELLQNAGYEARALQLDITDPEAVATLPVQLQDWWQELAILVNNAGISPKVDGKKREIIDMPVEEWNRVFAVNLTGMFLVTQACLPVLQQRGWGRIVMIASQAARTRTQVPGAHYQASKAGMVGFARVLAAEVARYGVTVNCVAPGRIESDMTAAVDAQVNGNVARSTPIGRMGRPEEVADAVGYLASNAASYSTGSILDVNGGSFMP